MKKSLLSLAVASALIAFTRVLGVRTQDIAFPFRMGAGFPGDVNRSHPFAAVPGLMNSSVQAPRLYGDPVIIDTATNSYRGITASDTTTFACDGLVIRPYPVQQTTGGMTSTIGNAAPATNQPVDILSAGFMMAKVNNGATVTKGGAVYVYTAVNSGNHVQGGLEGAAGANLTLVSNLFWNGPADANGIAEVKINAIRI